MIHVSASPKETQTIAESMGKKLKHGVICLYGDLGAGKTTFIRGLAIGLGIKSNIQSPTFTYLRVHTCKTKLYHFDFYRITKPDLMLISELNEVVQRKDGIIAIEWPEKIADYLPGNHTKVEFEYINSDTRKLTITLQK